MHCWFRRPNPLPPVTQTCRAQTEGPVPSGTGTLPPPTSNCWSLSFFWFNERKFAHHIRKHNAASNSKEGADPEQRLPTSWPPVCSPHPRPSPNLPAAWLGAPSRLLPGGRESVSLHAQHLECSLHVRPPSPRQYPRGQRAIEVRLLLPDGAIPQLLGYQITIP